MSQDCPDLMYPAKEVSQEMARPVLGSRKRLKKASRFVKSRKFVIWNYPRQDAFNKVEVHSDSDWGGSRGSRKSIPGGCLIINVGETLP